jgi:hypothetical protein
MTAGEVKVRLLDPIEGLADEVWGAEGESQNSTMDTAVLQYGKEFFRIEVSKIVDFVPPAT